MYTSSRSLIGKHMKQHGVNKPTIQNKFLIFKMCWKILDCLIYEMLFIQDLKPSLKLCHWTWFVWSYSISIITTHTGMPPNDIHYTAPNFNNFDIQQFLFLITMKDTSICQIMLLLKFLVKCFNEHYWEFYLLDVWKVLRVLKIERGTVWVGVLPKDTTQWPHPLKPNYSLLIPYLYWS